MAWTKWQQKLRGEKVVDFTDPTEHDEGYYRKPITEAQLGANGKTNGIKKIVGWTPIAYFMIDGVLEGTIGDRDMTGTEVIDNWTWCCRYPITEDLYRAVAERGEPWPDLQTVPAANREVEKTDNAAPAEMTDTDYAVAITNAIQVSVKVVTNEIEAAQALGSKNRIAELRLAAEKAGKALYQPLYNEYKKIYETWAPVVTLAAAAEKKLNTAILTFRESERRRVIKEAEEATAKQSAIDEANEKAAQLAISRGEPEPAPVIPEEAPPAAPPAPAPVVPTYGRRKLKEEEKWFLDEITDYDAVYAYFKDHEPMKAFLKTMAGTAVKAGQTVPGTKTHKGLI
jgi:hypothetical protein